MDSIAAVKLRTTDLLKDNIVCITTEDCLQSSYGQGKWCNSGLVCIRSKCHIIHGYPCDQFQTCNESQRKCTKKTCTQDVDCDDGLYCNGNENCDITTGYCSPSLNPIKCTGGQCNETLKECIFVPKVVTEWEVYKITGELIKAKIEVKLKSRLSGVMMVTKQDTLGIISVNDAPVNTTSSNSLTNTQITIVVSLIILFFGVTLFLLLLMMFMRAGVTSNTFVYTQEL
jgi:hypothetical protein